MITILMLKVLKNLMNAVPVTLAAALIAMGSADTAMAQGNTLIVSPSPVVLCGQPGQMVSAIPISISTSSGTVTFSVTSVTSNGQWLVVGPSGGTATTTPQTLLFAGVNGGTINLSAGTYSGSIVLSSNGSPIATINAQLQVGTSSCGSSGGGSLTSNQNSLSFQLPSGSTSGTQALSITNTSQGAVTISATATISNGQNWLSVNVPNPNLGAGASATVQVSVNAGSLTPGVTYNGQIAIAASNGATLNIPVTLMLSGSGGNSVLSANPNPLVLNVAFGTGQTTQIVQLTNLTTSPINVTTSASVSTGQTQNWLSVSPMSLPIAAGSTVNLTAGVNTTGLQAGTFMGSIDINVTTGQGGSLSIPVTLNYGSNGGGNAALSANPNPLNINIPSGTTTPVNQTVAVSSTAGAVSFTATASTTSGQPWLSVNPFSSTVSAGQPVNLTVSVQPSLLPAGASAGVILLTPTNGGQALQIPVNVTLGGAPSLTVMPAQFSFAYQTGTAFPQAQNLTLTSNMPANFSVQATTSSGNNWLVVSPLSGATSGSGGPPTAITVQVNPSGLPPNTYTGQIVITNTSSGTQQTIPVTLLVSNLPILAFGNSGTTFSYQAGSSTFPAQQSVPVTSSGNPLNFTASVTPVSGGNFLTVVPSSGVTPQTLTLSLNPSVISQLAPNTYTANVTVTSPGAGNSPVTYPVTLVVTNNTLLNPSQSSLSFNFQTGQAVPATQVISIASTGAPLSYTVTTSAQSCSGFLTATPASGTTPGNIAVSVNTSGVPAGVCMGMLSISSQGAGNSPLNIPVTLYVSASPLLNVSPSAISLTAQAGTNPANQTISLTSTDSATPINFNVTSMTNTSSGWLLVGPTSGTTPSNVNVAFNTSGLPVGVYTGSIQIAATGPANAPVSIPVTVTITSSATAAATPSSLAFVQAFQGQAPASQMLQVTSTTAGLTFSATASTFNGGNWLSVTNAGGVTPGVITVAANGGNLGQGVYNGTVTIVIPGAANSPINVPVTLTVGAAQSLTLSPAALSFSFQSGSATTPQAQPVQVSSAGGSVPFTVTTSAPSGTPTFVTVAPASGNTPGTVNIGLNQSAIANLAAGAYTNTVTFASANIPGGSQTLTVTLTVTAAAPPAIGTVVNAASLQPGAVAPGEIVSLFGAGIGPSSGQVFQLTAQGAVPTIIANTTVTFDGIPAPLLFVRNDQINAIVPYEVAGRAVTNVVVSRNGVVSMTLQLRVADTAPAIFSLSQGGNGQGAILNFDSTVNSPANPAAKGTVIQIFATGEGALNPRAVTGSVTPSTPPFPKPGGAVSVTVGGQPAQVQYAGEAPGLVSGVLQVNVVVPQNIGSGPQTVVLNVGNGSNNLQTITVQVQ